MSQHSLDGGKNSQDLLLKWSGHLVRKIGSEMEG